jgi:acetyl/propionyl-CoA carboxylase alpha subunit
MELEFRGADGALSSFSLESNRGQTFCLTLDGVQLSGSWLRAGPNTISLHTDDGQSHVVHLAHDGDGGLHLQLDGRVWKLSDPGAGDEAAGGGCSADAGGDINEQGEILSPMPGKIVGVPVSLGDKVAAGDLLVILESMKMENPILSPVDGTVASLPLAEGDAAALGQPLIQLDVDEA